MFSSRAREMCNVNDHALSGLLASRPRMLLLCVFAPGIHHLRRPSADVYSTSVSASAAPSSGSNSPPIDGWFASGYAAGGRHVSCRSPLTKDREEGLLGRVRWRRCGL
jgi:hypothetical protein